MDEHKINRFYGIMLCMAIIVAFAFQGSRGIYDTTEGRYAEVAREMLESGNYLEPTLMYQPHWTKPPLAYLFRTGPDRLLVSRCGVYDLRGCAWCVLAATGT